MAKIRLKTISPIHIGSGVLYHNNMDCVIKNENGHNMVGIIDEEKIAGIIGIEHVEEWVQYIERQKSVLELIKKYAPSATLPDFTSRTMPIYVSSKEDDTVKEFIHDGYGHAYIPGSSIKGAMRSALLAQLVSKVDNRENLIQKFKGKKIEISASEVEKRVFGSDPNKDIFRFIKVGDAIFDYNVEEAIRLVMYLNITESDSLLTDKDRKPQIVEVIRSGAEAEFNLTVDTKYNQFVADRTKDNPKTFTKALPSVMKDLQSVFESVNKHTTKLINEEIDYWTCVSEDLTGAESYLHELKQIQSQLCNLSENECVIRIGHGSGWDFITGGWAKDLENFDDVVVPAARPKNEQKYREYDFPKSRRLDEQSHIIGFVKLTIEA